MQIDFNQASLITAIKTPYLPDGNIDYDRYDKLVERQIKGKVQGLIIGGTTGEGHLMDWDEHLALIAHSVKNFGHDLLIIGNTGSNNTKEALHATSQGFKVGMHMALQINPYYGKTNEQGLLAHFQRLLDLGPALIYNVPGRTAQDLQPALIEQVAQHKNLVGMKECAGNDRIALYQSKGIACWSGNDDQAHDARHQAGARGVISVTSNVIPKTMRRLMDAPNDQLNQALQPLFTWMFLHPNPIPLNSILAQMGLALPIFRLPYAPVSKDMRKKGKEILEALELDDALEAIQVMEDQEFKLVC